MKNADALFSLYANCFKVFITKKIFLFSIFKANNTVDYYRKKFENVKSKARQRETIQKKQLETGGGVLSKAEQRIIQSPAYADLAIKLGISAFGNTATADSDATLDRPPAPTQRLEKSLNASEGMCIFVSFCSKLKIFKSHEKFELKFNYFFCNFYLLSLEQVDLTGQPDFMNVGNIEDLENSIGENANNTQTTCK